MIYISQPHSSIVHRIESDQALVALSIKHATDGLERSPEAMTAAAVERLATIVANLLETTGLSTSEKLSVCELWGYDEVEDPDQALLRSLGHQP